MSLFGPALRCQVCGATDTHVDSCVYSERLRYFACVNCWNKLTKERNDLPEAKELFLVTDIVDHFRGGGNLINLVDVHKASKSQFELLNFLVEWMRKKMVHEPFVRLSDAEALEHMRAGKH